MRKVKIATKRKKYSNVKRIEVTNIGAMVFPAYPVQDLLV